MNQCVCKVCGHDEEKCDFNEVHRRAMELIYFKGVASAALLQRDLKISYAKAAQVLDLLEGQEIIGPTDGAKPRKINYDQLEAHTSLRRLKAGRISNRIKYFFKRR